MIFVLAQWLFAVVDHLTCQLIPNEFLVFICLVINVSNFLDELPRADTNFVRLNFFFDGFPACPNTCFVGRRLPAADCPNTCFAGGYRNIVICLYHDLPLVVPAFDTGQSRISTLHILNNVPARWAEDCFSHVSCPSSNSGLHVVLRRYANPFIVGENHLMASAIPL